MKYHRSSRPEVFCKKVFLKISQNLQKNTCEFYKIFKNTFMYTAPPGVAFDTKKYCTKIQCIPRADRICIQFLKEFCKSGLDEPV